MHTNTSSDQLATLQARLASLHKARLRAEGAAALAAAAHDRIAPNWARAWVSSYTPATCIAIKQDIIRNCIVL